MPQVPSVGTDETVYSECLAQGSCILRAQSSAGPGINRPGQRLEEGEGTASQGITLTVAAEGRGGPWGAAAGKARARPRVAGASPLPREREAGSEASPDGDGRHLPSPRCAGPRERVASA